MFSPRARGCSFSKGVHYVDHRRFPRVRGDVPKDDSSGLWEVKFSPRARGCSFLFPALGQILEVFPACAGMFPTLPPRSRIWASFPRVRGDVPVAPNDCIFAEPFSPRARGCSRGPQRLHFCGTVFPACAGMFPLDEEKTLLGCRFPRVRGDVPTSPLVIRTMTKFSPRARGCSYYAVSL